MKIEELKNEIWIEIAKTNDAAILQIIKEMLQKVSSENELFNRIIKPMRKSMTVEDLIKEQNYKGFDRARFDKLIDELDIQDPIDELLNSLTP